MAAGGQPRPPQTANTELFDGTNWTEVNNLNTAREELCARGTTTSAVAFGGTPPPTASITYTGKTETWDGTSWTETTDMNTARAGLDGAGESRT